MLDCFLNINSYFDYRVFTCDGLPHTRDTLTVLPPSLAAIELSRDQFIPIPAPLLAAYSVYRPTPIFRATAFEKAIGTSCRIYMKDEGGTPSGNHKMNSALCIAHLCRQDGIATIATETTGNWGIALTRAAARLGIATVCVLDAVSDQERPESRRLMESAGASVLVVADDHAHGDLLSLSADAAIRYTQQQGATYIFGSVYGYFLVPQSLVGLEAKWQLQQLSLYPDVVVGSCGGGANLMGIASPFLVDRIEAEGNAEILSAEAAQCPILTTGRHGLHGIDTLGYYPLLYTYGLDGIVDDGSYIGGLGSTIVASAAAHFHSIGFIRAHAFRMEDARQAAELFFASEGRRVALETCYILAGVIRVAEERMDKTILASISALETGFNWQ